MTADAHGGLQHCQMLAAAIPRAGSTSASVVMSMTSGNSKRARIGLLNLKFLRIYLDYCLNAPRPLLEVRIAYEGA